MSSKEYHNHSGKTIRQAKILGNTKTTINVGDSSILTGLRHITIRNGENSCTIHISQKQAIRLSEYLRRQ